MYFSYIIIHAYYWQNKSKEEKNKEIDTSVHVLGITIKVTAFMKFQNAYNKIMLLLASKISILLCAGSNKKKGKR